MTKIYADVRAKEIEIAPTKSMYVYEVYISYVLDGGSSRYKLFNVYESEYAALYVAELFNTGQIDLWAKPV